MQISQIVSTVLACLALGLIAGAGTMVAARIIGVEPLPPGVLAALIGVIGTGAALQGRHRV